MKFMPVLTLAAFALMACGQLKPSEKKNQSNLFGVAVPGCVIGQVKNATSFNPQKATLEAVQVCPGSDAASVIVTSASPICVYPVVNGVPTYPGQCTQPNAANNNKSDLRFAGSPFGTITYVVQTDQMSYESGNAARGGTIVVPWAQATFR